MTRALPVLCALWCALPLAAHAQPTDEGDDNRPPSWVDADEAEGDTPELTAAGSVTVSFQGTQATVGMLNPHLDASPLWLWVSAEGQRVADVAVLDGSDRILWHQDVGSVGKRGVLVVVPRPMVHAQATLDVALTVPGAPPQKRPLSLMHARIQQMSLPLLVVGGAESSRLADRLRDRAGERLVHVIPSRSLPAAPAAFLGVGGVVVGADAVVPDEQGRALRLFSCARGGVVMLAPHALPPAMDCADPPQVDGSLAPDAFLRALRDHPVGLGVLEERGTPGLLSPAVEDTQAAAALMTGRPPAPLGVGLMLLSLVLMGVAVAWSRRFSAPRALLLMAAAPVAGALVISAVGMAWSSTLDHVRLVTVDARAGARVALVRTVDVSRVRIPPPSSPTAWVFAPSQMPGGQTRTVSVSDVVDVIPSPTMSVAVDAQDGERSRIKAADGNSVAAWPCRSDAEPDGASAVARAQGLLLKDRCGQLRGSVAPVPPDWFPAIAARLTSDDPRTGVGGWMYVYGEVGR